MKLSFTGTNYSKKIVVYMTLTNKKEQLYIPKIINI